MDHRQRSRRRRDRRCARATGRCAARREEVRRGAEAAGQLASGILYGLVLRHARRCPGRPRQAGRSQGGVQARLGEAAGRGQLSSDRAGQAGRARRRQVNVSAMYRVAMVRSGYCAIAGLALVALALSGCGGSPTVKPAELVKFKPNAQAKVVWRSSVGGADVYIFTPSVDEGAVYAAGASGTLARFDAATGKQAWRVDTKEQLSGGVGADSDLVVVGTRKGAVLAYDLKGKLAWKTQVSSEVLMAPRAAQGVVVVRSGDGKIYALNAGDGKSLWEY